MRHVIVLLVHQGHAHGGVPKAGLHVAAGDLGTVTVGVLPFAHLLLDAPGQAVAVLLAPDGSVQVAGIVGDRFADLPPVPLPLPGVQFGGEVGQFPLYLIRALGSGILDDVFRPLPKDQFRHAVGLIRLHAVVDHEAVLRILAQGKQLRAGDLPVSFAVVDAFHAVLIHIGSGERCPLQLLIDDETGRTQQVGVPPGGDVRAILRPVQPIQLGAQLLVLFLQGRGVGALGRRVPLVPDLKPGQHPENAAGDHVGPHVGEMPGQQQGNGVHDHPETQGKGPEIHGCIHGVSLRNIPLAVFQIVADQLLRRFSHTFLRVHFHSSPKRLPEFYHKSSSYAIFSALAFARWVCYHKSTDYRTVLILI